MNAASPTNPAASPVLRSERSGGRRSPEALGRDVSTSGLERMPARTGGAASAHQKTPRTATRPSAKKPPSHRRDGQGPGRPRRASTAATASAERKNSAPV